MAVHTQTSRGGIIQERKGYSVICRPSFFIFSQNALRLGSYEDHSRIYFILFSKFSFFQFFFVFRQSMIWIEASILSKA